MENGEYVEFQNPYRLEYLPKNADSAYYWERVDRNIGWITKEEQEILRKSVVGIAGCGGMGGLIASILLRVGVGEIRIADSETFDATNINRQFAAKRSTVGKSKAMATVEELRSITDDTKIVVYPKGGICPETVEHFVSGCDVILDEIEFFVVSARILLHQVARRHGVSLFNCNTVGFGTRLFLFNPESVPIEDILGLSLSEATSLLLTAKSSSYPDQKRQAVLKIAKIMMENLVPELPEYRRGDHDMAWGSLLKGRAPIIGTNPPMASGFLSDRVLFHLLRNSGVQRDILETPTAPSYLYFDAGKMEAKLVWR